MEAVECGAASLTMICSYYGLWIPLEKMREQCSVTRNGANALNLIKAARTHGFTATGNRLAWDALAGIKLPAILFWRFSHFVVLEGFTREGAWLNDPSAGPRFVAKEEFIREYSGVALTFETTPQFKRGGHRKSTWKAIRKRVRGSESGLLYVFLAALALVVPGLVIPSFLRVFVDEIIGNARHRWILWLFTAMAGMATLNAIITFMKSYFLARLETRLAVVSSSEFFWHVLHLPMAFFSQRMGGDIASRVEINDKVASLSTGSLASAALNVLMVGFYGMVMYFYDPLLTLITAGLSAMNFILLTVISRTRVDANMSLLSVQSKVQGTTVSGLAMIETLKATGRESDFFVRWAGYTTRMVNTQQHLSTSSLFLSVFPTLVSSLSNLAVIYFGGMRVMRGDMTMGMLIAFQSLSGQFVSPINSMVSYGSQMQELVGDLSRLEDVLLNDASYPPDEADLVTRDSSLGRLDGRLELKNLTFGYSRIDPPQLDSFSMTLEPGQRVALVGSTGSGKSTLGKLICGLLDAWSGEILFDGKPRTAWPRSVITTSLAQVDQDIVLFAGTLRENLTLWDNDIDEASITQALKDAGIYEAVISRPSGIDAEVQEAAHNFSGGERQRLEIARALVTNPRILVLDEATSALDPIVEKKIDQAVRRRGCTCVIIAHRLSTIRDADEIIVLEHGKVVERGDHETLVARKGEYWKLIQAEISAQSQDQAVAAS
ncbi:MAG: NHLP family bacteriocin export ABC transporter peptidase/permease/ATPase subunit [Proteobacteria bacterium]|nr:NHLP family bacteriocin export ABC transporter peptidase/permease/ATPase subunit [Pseudomonadota bacterium]